MATLQKGVAMNRIFISYRRQDSTGLAGRIYDRLTGRFGGQSVYMDVDAIPPGVDFREHITSTMDHAKVVLALIGSSWLHMPGPKGHRRLDDPDDFVRVELELALKRGVPVIPVLLGHAPMPKSDELPDSISRLAYFNAARVNDGHDFNTHAERLIRELDSRLHPGGTGIIPPGEDIATLLKIYFEECDALITASPEHTLIIEANTELIGFRNFINLFEGIERNDGKARPLIWIIDMGRQQYSDLDSRLKFINVQTLLARFKALKRFDDHGANRRWQWLQSRAVIVVLDTRADGPSGEPAKRPTFVAHNVSLTTIDTAWIDSANFRQLYGNNFERVKQRNFSVFFNSTANWRTPPAWETEGLRYFGYAQFPSPKMRGEFHARGLELPPLPANYVDAFTTVCASAASVLGIDYTGEQLSHINGKEATQRLRYLGYFVLRLDEFMETY